MDGQVLGVGTFMNVSPSDLIPYTICSFFFFFNKSGVLGLISLQKNYNTSQVQFLLWAAFSYPFGGGRSFLLSRPGKSYQEEALFLKGTELSKSPELILCRYKGRPGKGPQKRWKEHSGDAKAWKLSSRPACCRCHAQTWSISALGTGPRWFLFYFLKPAVGFL